MNLKTITKITAFLSSMTLLQCSVILPSAYAEDGTADALAENSSFFNDDGGKFRRVPVQYALSKSTSTDETLSEEELPAVTMDALTHSSRFDTDYLMIDGIDVSKYQKQIDWEAVAAEGVEFAIIRLGFRGYGSAGNMKIDDYFEANYEGAKAAGLDVGVYFFTQAISEEEAIEEANFVLETLQGRELDAPVYYDIENITYDVGRLDSAALTAEEHTSLCDAFCETIMDAGYKAGVYANSYWLSEKLNAEQLEAKYPIWLANYTNETLYEGEYQLWQYTSQASISGIETLVDRNVLYSRMADFVEESIILDTLDPVLPEILGDGKLEFTSSDPSVASVDETGCITPLTNGSTVITVVSDNGSADTMDVTVNTTPAFSLNHTMLHFTELKKLKCLKVTGTENTIYWMSTNDAIVSVSSNGFVKSLDYGSAQIVAMDIFGNSAVCDILITDGEIKIGDCNADGVIDASDAAIILTYSASHGVNSDSEISETMLTIYDANMDGSVDALDASAILKLSASAGTVK